MDSPSPTSDDDTLLAAWRAGDEGAFATLVGRHHRVVRAACRRQLPDGDVDDAVQAVFLLLARRPAAAARAPVLAAWLLRVAHLTARNLHRRERRRRHAEALAVPPAAPGHEPDPAQLDRLDAALMALRPAQRDALVLHVVGNAAPAEIADRLGTSRDHAYKLIQRGLAALRSRLGGALPTTTALAALLAPAESAEAAGLVPVLTGPPSDRAHRLATALILRPWWIGITVSATGGVLVATVVVTVASGGLAHDQGSGAEPTTAGVTRGMPVADNAPFATRAEETDPARASAWDTPVRPMGGDSTKTESAAAEGTASEPPAITLKVANMRAVFVAGWLSTLGNVPVTLDPGLKDHQVDLDFVDTPIAVAVGLFAAACDAEVEELPGGGYHLRAQPKPRPQ